MIEPLKESPGINHTRSTVRLADGRTLIYFDDLPGRRHLASDGRHILPMPGSPQIRHDPVLDEWVIVASHRQQRTHLPSVDKCPLCPSTNGNSTEIPDGDYDVVVFENRFPSMVLTSNHISSDGLLAQGPATGASEVICFSSDHGSSFSDLPPHRLKTIGRALVDRTIALSRLSGVEYVFCFENRGEEIGVTLHHPHGQIYAYPFVPPRVRRGLDSAERYMGRTGRCLFCDVYEAELMDGRRIVSQTPNFVAFVPWAPRWPLEVHIYARRHIADLSELSPDELEEAMMLQADVLARFDGAFPRPVPYIAAWLQAPVSTGRTESHLRLEAFSPRRSAEKLKFLAGSESAAGVFINDVVPEQAAEVLRKAEPAAISLPRDETWADPGCG
jgi:UDPglucose--hexose-1-phosphate uridylyltransferase